MDLFFIKKNDRMRYGAVRDGQCEKLCLFTVYIDFLEEIRSVVRKEESLFQKISLDVYVLQKPKKQ